MHGRTRKQLSLFCYITEASRDTLVLWPNCTALTKTRVKLEFFVTISDPQFWNFKHSFDCFSNKKLSLEYIKNVSVTLILTKRLIMIFDYIFFILLISNLMFLLELSFTE